jgi:hypothetical protein
MRPIRTAALTVALLAALSPALLPHFSSTWVKADSGTHIPLIGAFSNSSAPAVPVKAQETDLALSLSLHRFRPQAGALIKVDDRYSQSLLAVEADPEIGAARAELDRFEQAVAVYERTVEYRRLVGSSLLLLAFVGIGVFALRTYRLSHRCMGAGLLACTLAFVPLAIPNVTKDRVLVPVLRLVNLLSTRYVKVVSVEALDLPEAPAGEVWGHAALEAARPDAVARIAENTRDQHEQSPMADDLAIARRQFVRSLALAAAATFISIGAWSRKQVSRWHPRFRSHFPTLWPKDRSRVAITMGEPYLAPDVVSDSAA